MVNVKKVDGLGIFLKSGVNSPRGGKLRNPFSRRVERKRGGDVSRSTPIASVGPLDQIYLPRVGRIGSTGSGHKVRDASELSESPRVPSSVHKVHVSDTVGPGVRSVTVGPLNSSESTGSVHMTDSTVSEDSLNPGECQFKNLRAQTDGLTEVEVDENDILTDNYGSNSDRSSDCKCSALGSAGSGGLIQS